MNIVQKKLVNVYVILVLARETHIEDVPESKVIGGITYPIREEVEKEIKSA